MQIEKYFKKLEEDIHINYDIARKAREKGLDPKEVVEVPLARNLAEKCVGLISSIHPQVNDDRIVKRIIELEKEYGALDVGVCLKIAEEIAKEKYCKFASLKEGIEVGIRIGFAYTTLGVVSSPIEGFTFLKFGKTSKGEDYFMPYFSGPIRSAGTTASCVVLLIIDHLREIFGFAKYDPTENEVKRTVTELFDFHDRITNLQYLPTEEEAEFLARNLPIQVSGEPSESLEVSNFKDLARVDTNYLRSGVCLVLAEGLAQKAQKAQRILKGLREKGFKLSDWDFLEEYCKLHEKRSSGSKDLVATYMKDLVAGRPIFGHPSRSGGFRFRYGRSRVSGFSAVSVHPATMAISDNFLAVGTQLKIEKPTKGCVISVCDSIDGPIVKLKNGSVRKINDYEIGKAIYKDIDEIIYFGDILFPFGDVANRNSILLKSGYVEEWWNLELNKVGQSVEDYYNVSLSDAIKYSKEFYLPLHPSYIYYWNQIDYESFLELLRWFSYARLNEKIILPYGVIEREKFEKGKRALEILGIEHDVTTENVVIDPLNSKAFFINLGLDINLFENENYFIEKEINLIAQKSVNGIEKNVLNIINDLSEFKIKDKAGDFIGTRMGRPEKAKLRKLTGSPHIIFSVGEEGGRFRSVNESVNLGYINAEYPAYFCEKCNKETIYNRCEECKEKTILLKYCPICNRKLESDMCEVHNSSSNYYKRRIDIKHYFNDAVKRLSLSNGEVPVLIKGVRGTSSKNHVVENLSKGILRSKYNLNVNKDGTIRYDMTELPVSYFKPKEVGVSIEKLKSIGYTLDKDGKELTNEDQIIELMPHDIILPCNSESGDERADEVFMNIANFIDEMLVKLYGLKPFYNIKKREDLVGHLAVCMAPHNCAGVISRIVGFSKTQGLMASPYMHAAMRRDCFYPNTKFVFSDNSIINNEPIGEYVENLITSGAKIKKIDSFGTLRIDSGKELFAFGVNPNTMKLKKKKIKHFIKSSPPQKWVKIKTASGREQIMTATHRAAYLDEKNRFKVKKAEEYKVGDKIAILNNFGWDKFKPISEFNLIKVLIENTPNEDLKKVRLNNACEFFKEIINKNGRTKILDLLRINKNINLSGWYRSVNLNDLKILIKNDLITYEDIPKNAFIRTVFNNKQWKINWKIEKSLMSILGTYAAEGYHRQNKTVSQVCFRIMDESQQNKLVKAIKEYFEVNASLGENNTKITICEKLIYYLFRDYFKVGKNAYEKKVPNIIYNVKEELVKEYLSSYFDGDGTILYQTEKENHKKAVVFYSVSRQLVDGISLICSKFGIFGRFSTTKERLPGKKVLERYKELKKEPKKHILHHLSFSSSDFDNIIKILNSVNYNKKILINKAIKQCTNSTIRRLMVNNEGHKIEKKGDVLVDYIKEVNIFEEKTSSYCFEIDWENEEDKNVLWGENILNLRCDGDEAASMMLLDVLINFSKEYLPGHRGGTQDAPLVLNGKIAPGEVDDQILDFELMKSYPLELYEMAEKREHSSKIKMDSVKARIKEGKDPFRNINYTHETSDFNEGVLVSSYKKIPTMQEKVEKEMELVKKIRAVDASDVARLIIERHFIRDIRGNLRKFSQQGFRCVKCNSKFRRPPLSGVCLKCNGKIIFTINEGGIIKYLEPALKLAEDYDIPVYVKQNIELTKRYIESIFGREETKQADLGQWFG